MLKRISLLIIITFLLLGCSLQNQQSKSDDSVFSWVDSNNAVKVEKWLNDGGNPNLKHTNGESLLYIATGPRGGNDVLRVLLNHKANVDEGFGKYTPLINAASWNNYEAVKLLLEAGANANLKTEDNKAAIDLIGKGDNENSQLIREVLSSEMKD